MIALLQMELSTEAEDVLSSLEAEADSAESEGDPLSLTESNTPCLDILLSENIPAHILAASRMPVSPKSFPSLVFTTPRPVALALVVELRTALLKVLGSNQSPSGSSGGTSDCLSESPGFESLVQAVL